MWLKQLFALVVVVVGQLFSVQVNAQGETIVLDSSNSHRKVIAGQYNNKSFHKFLFGKHYRDEWHTPVQVPVLYLDTVHGGLKPYEAGGGRQSKSLKLRDKEGREYVLRSLDKSFGRALPEILQGSFVEDVIDDQVTIGHPYSAFTIPSMAEAAKINHTNPVMVYVPKQNVLDTFNTSFGNRLYLLEQRPDGDWSTAANFGHSPDIIGTEKLMQKLLKSSDNRVDQALYVRSRLFDMFIGDWGRHEDQWRWGGKHQGALTIYEPIPRDRDQAYTKFDGLLTEAMLSSADLGRLQTFERSIKDIKTFNFAARYLDRRMANELTKEQWLNIAKELQALLTDDVIRSAVRRMPPEVYPVSGQVITEKLMGHRDRLLKMAGEYYDFLARHVNVVGTEDDDYFEVSRLNDDETQVKVFDLDKSGGRSDQPFYSRVFKTSETNDVRLYGINGNDVFHIDGKTKDGIDIKVIGGPKRDSVIDNSKVSGLARKVTIYDDRDNYFERGAETRLHLSGDSAVHVYDYDDFRYHKKGIKVNVLYDFADRFSIGAGYGFKHHQWRNPPFGFEQALYLRYSISQNALSLVYDGRFRQAVGKWDMLVSTRMDFIRWTNYFGLGNETEQVTPDIRYYRLRTNEFRGSMGLERQLGKHHTVNITGAFAAIKVLDQPPCYISDNYTSSELNFFERYKYLSGGVAYLFRDVDNEVMPQKGFVFNGGAAYTQNINAGQKNFITSRGVLQLYIPLVQKFSLAIKGGVTHVTGRPEFFQYASIGGTETLRGYRRDRFWGQTAFYNNNELRWITDIRTKLVNGKFGLVAFVDEGRVWMPGELSDKWHVGYGGGVMLAPFNLFTLSVNYGFSEEFGRFHVRLYKLMKSK